MKSYYRVMLGQKSIHSAECLAGNFIGAHYDVNEDLTDKLKDGWKEFNAALIPIFLATHPDKTKIGAGLACGAIWTISKGIQQGDIVLCPDGNRRYRVGEVCGDYYYAPGQILPHRRQVKWLEASFDRDDMSQALKNSSGGPGTVSDISSYHEEIDHLIAGVSVSQAAAEEQLVESSASFAMEKHLEDFLVKNWSQTELGKEFDIFAEDGEQVGQQYPTDTGPLDILAISKDKKRLLVVELKRGRASDRVVGQILRYMGYVQEQLAEPGQTVHGVIIALEDDKGIQRALTMTPTITFYRYEISFKLVKG